MANIEGVNPGWYGKVNFFIDTTDDPLLVDGVPAFDGGQFSNLRANLLTQNQSSLLGNCDVDNLGKQRTRRGTILLNDPTKLDVSPSGVASTIIQGLTSYQTPTANYVVAANNGMLWQWNDSARTWTRIGTGGIADQDDMLIFRTGSINNFVAGPPVVSGYPLGATVLTVDLITGIVGAGEKLYFLNNLRKDWWEYTIASASGTPTTSITLENPGLVFPVLDDWNFVVARPAKVNGSHPGGYAGTSPIAISNYGVTGGVTTGGTVNVGEVFVIKSENRSHKVLTCSGSPTTSIDTWTKVDGSADALQADWVASSITSPIIFAQGNDLLYFTDGVGGIYAWNGKTTMNIQNLATLDYLTGSALHQARTMPPKAVNSMVWAQNRLIASALTGEPDAIYFSDFFDGTSWDQDYQKIRVGGGESDPVAGIVAWTNFYLLVFKKNSIYIVNLDPSQNPDPTDPTLLVASYGITQVHKLIGCPAPLTAVQVGGGSTTPGSDVFFLDGDKRVHSVRRVMAAEQQQQIGQAMSLPIQDVLDSINRNNISRCNAMYHNEHYILSFPTMLAPDGGVYASATVAYNLLTQSWCGVWSWAPTCFSRRTDLGSYSKLILGDWRGGTGRVLQWLDDQSLQEETTASYQDFGNNFTTSILTRAFTFGDYYSYKTALYVEFEFDQSSATGVVINVILDKVPARDPITGSDALADPFDTSTSLPLVLPFLLPATLPVPPTLLRKGFDLQRFGTWRELQFQINAATGKLSVRSIRVAAFMDTVRLQTLPMAGVPALGIPPPLTSGGP